VQTVNPDDEACVGDPSPADIEWLDELEYSDLEEDAPRHNGGAHTNGASKLRVDDRREIKWRPCELHEVLEETVEALADPQTGDPGLFSRAFQLVGVSRARGPSAVPDGTPTIRRITAGAMVPRLTRRITYITYSPKMQMWVPAPPHPQLVGSLLDAAEWSGIRPIVGVTESPVVRPDGTLRQEAGYDAATGYLYVPACDYPAVADNPTRDDAVAALGELQAVFRDFPYVEPAHAAAPLAAILTVLARPAIAGSVPAFLFDASTRGSGKTLQADAVALVATGRTARRQNFPEDDDELAKVLSSYAIACAPLALLDNVTRPFGGGPLDMVITARDSIAFRALGRNEILELPWRTVIMASGNNLSLGEDTIRRVLVARIESKLENPEDRVDVEHEDLLGWIRNERPRLVSAALTVLRSYFSHGCPDMGTARWGSFEGWSRLIPPAIVWAGGSDPMAARPRGERAVTDEAAAVRTLLRRLPDLFTEPTHLRALVDAVYPAPGRNEPPDGYDDVRDALEHFAPSRLGQPPALKALGNAMRKHIGRIFEGRSLGRSLDRNGVALWRVMTYDAPRSEEANFSIAALRHDDAGSKSQTPQANYADTGKSGDLYT
jgi:hypothetical protein